MANATKKVTSKAKPAAKKKPSPPASKSARKPAPPAKAASKKKTTKAPAKPVATKKAPAKAASAKKDKAPAAAPKKPALVSKGAGAPKKAAPAPPAAKTAKPTAPAPAPAKPAKTAAPAPATAPKAVEKAPAQPAPAPAKKAEPAAKAKAAKIKEPILAVMTGVEPIGGPARALKRAMKERFTLEFYLRATPGSLFDLISTPSGFSEWFCDDVDVRGDQYSFRWGSDTQVADCLSRKFGELMRFQWKNDEDPGSYFEFRIRIDPMTNETCLVVTDHAWPQDLDEAKALWGSQIHTLQRVLGA